MRILLVAVNLPYPPASGGLLRIYGLMNGLHQAGYELTLMSFADEKIDPTKTPLVNLCQQIITIPPQNRTKLDRVRDLIFTRQPDIARRFFSVAFADKLRELLAQNQFDLIQFEGIESVCYLPIAKQAQPNAKFCFDTFNAEYILQRGIFEIDRRTSKRWPAALYSYVQSRRIEQFEGDMCRLADAVIAVSTEDADLLRPFRQDARVYVVPNGIFIDDYTNQETKINLGENVLVFTGKMDYRPNVDGALWFVEQVFPKIREHVPDVQFYIVGQQPHPRLDGLRQIPDVHLTGWVDSTQPYLSAADVYVAPLRMGSGTRLKLLEAMATGCAIVATTAAAAGLHSEAKQGMIVSDNEHAMADSIIDLLQNPGKQYELRQNAQQIVKQYYDWSVLIPHLLEAYREIGLG